MMKSSLFLFFFFLSVFFTNLMAQDLPHWMTEEEKLMMPSYLEQISQRGIATPPPHSSLRNPAEWEEMEGVAVTWTSYKPVLTEIIRHAREQCSVYVICTDSNAVKTYLTNENVNLSGIYYIHQEYNSVWIRDYGPNSVYVNDVDSMFLVDWIYNRPRPKDDVIPQAIGDHLGIDVYETTTNPWRLVNTGGNYCSDGFGNAFASELILEDNPTLSIAEIDTIQNRFLGVDRYTKMEILPYDGIHHIDMHFKLLNEETLLVAEYPAGVADGPQIEDNLNYVLNNFNSVFGTPYKVVRIPSPPSVSGYYPPTGYYRTYTNSLILNKLVLVPLYYEQYDTTALRIYREAMPGYTVVGINCEQVIQASGAIHCISHEIASRDPLWISHQNHPDAEATLPGYEINAKIVHKTGIQEATVWYRTDTLQPYLSVAMALTDPVNHIWTGEIPAQIPGSRIYYYIHATAVSGKEQVRPMPAPAGWFTFKVLPASILEVSLGTDILIYHNESATLTPVVTYGNPPFSYLWSDNSVLPSLLVDGSQTGTGTFYYAVTVTDQAGLSATDEVMVTVEFNNSIDDPAAFRFRIWPNPADGLITIDCNPAEFSDGMISITDLTGRVVCSQPFTSPQMIVPVADLATGIYILRILSNRFVASKRFVIKR
jgi:agmatine deiminase